MASFISFENLQKEDSRITAELKISDQLPSLAGHFPGNPVLPAVSIIDISTHLLSHIKGHLSFNKMAIGKSKFSGMVRPGDDLILVGEKMAERSWKVEWLDRHQGTKLAQVVLEI